jgi:1,5-anhydro-D-fructose reductase (1,5-anhydro-D-mannitol-forming)
MIRIGIVGCGRILAAHLQGYRWMREAGCDDFRITALCSRRLDDARSYVHRDHGPTQRPPCSQIPGDPLAVPPQYLSDFQETDSVEVYDDFEAMCRTGPVDAVNDLTHHALHHRVAEVAAASGQHLLTQKPIAVNVAVAKRMCDLYRERRLTLGVFENWHYRPIARYLQRLLETNLLGEPQMFAMGSLGAWWAPNRIVADTPWRHVAKQGGGISLDMGVHQLHWVRQMAGDIASIHANTQVAEPRRYGPDPSEPDPSEPDPSEPDPSEPDPSEPDPSEPDPSEPDPSEPDQRGPRSEIECDADDTFWANCQTKSGVCGQLFSSWAGRGEPTVIQPGPVLYTTRCRVAGDHVHWDDGRVEKLSDLYAAHVATEQKESDFPRGIVDEFALTQMDWLKAITGGCDPETSGQSGLRDLAAAFAILESSESGQVVNVDDVLEGRVANYQRKIEATPIS